MMYETRRAVALQILDVMPLVARLVALELRRGHLGLDPVHFRLLKRLSVAPCSLSDLARWQGVSLPTMSNTASTLAGRGLVERTRETDDRRLLRLAITPAGGETLTAIQEGLVAGLVARLESRTPAEISALADGLVALVSALESLPAGECRQTTACPTAGGPPAA